MADEATDISNKEQLSIVVRYVDRTRVIREAFLGFCHLSLGCTGIAIKNEILNEIKNFGLDIKLCRGQGYDGAGAVAGIYNGTAALIRSEYNKAVFVHCSSHRLNLCVAASCSIQIVREMMDNCKSIADFFNNSPKRQSYLIENVKKYLPDSNHFVLKDVCRTRWIERINGLERTMELYVPIMKTVEGIRYNLSRENANASGTWNHNTVSLAAGLHKKLLGFEFLISLKVVSRIIGFTSRATVLLQKTEMDLAGAKTEIDDVLKKCFEFRANINIEHGKLYQEAVEMGAMVGELPTMPRVVSTQIHRPNAPATTPEDYYRINLTENFLAYLITSLTEKFDESTLIVYEGFFIIPKILVHLVEQKIPWKNKLKKFIDFYQADLPNIGGLDSELDMWETRWVREARELREKKSEKTVPKRIADTLQTADKDYYPNIGAMLNILAVVPATTCSCERSISALRRLKTWLRSTMTNERLTGLALMHVHRNMDFDIETIIDNFARAHPRRMRLLNVVSSDE